MFTTFASQYWVPNIFSFTLLLWYTLELRSSPNLWLQLYLKNFFSFLVLTQLSFKLCYSTFFITHKFFEYLFLSVSLSYLPYWFLFGDFSQLFSSFLLHFWLTTSGGLASRVFRQGDGDRTGRRATCCCLTIVRKEWSCLVDRGWSAQAAVYCIDGATTSHCLPPTFYPPSPMVVHCFKYDSYLLIVFE